jgi:hypothetical protein
LMTAWGGKMRACIEMQRSSPAPGCFLDAMNLICTPQIP